MEGLPEGATLVENPYYPGTFDLNYSPNYLTAKGEYYGYKEFEVKLRAATPRGQSAEQSFKIKVRDYRLDPNVSLPDELSVGDVASFVIGASDPNGEVYPEITVDTSSPVNGSLRIERTTTDYGSDGVLPSRQAFVRWDGVSFPEASSPQSARFRICVHSNYYDMLQCTERTVRVQFAANIHSAPRIQRDSWELGAVQYLKVGQPAVFAVPVQDPDSASNLVDVQVRGDSLGQVSWYRDQLTIMADTPGPRTFVLVARSKFGVVSEETFSYEVLPASWSPVLILGDGYSDPEVKVALQAFPGAAVYNPALQLDGGRVLALRTTLVLGTGLFAAGEVDEDFLSKALKQVPNVILATPLVDKVPTNLLAQGFRAVGRYSGQPGMPPLKSTKLMPVAGAGFSIPAQGPRLRGSFSTESGSPMLLAATTSNCAPAFELRSRATLGTVALSCGRKAEDGTRGRLLIAGFEWADLEFMPSEAGFLQKWLQEGVRQ
jgi:hypothetical protein